MEEERQSQQFTPGLPLGTRVLTADWSLVSELRPSRRGEGQKRGRAPHLMPRPHTLTWMKQPESPSCPPARLSPGHKAPDGQRWVCSPKQKAGQRARTFLLDDFLQSSEETGCFKCVQTPVQGRQREFLLCLWVRGLCLPGGLLEVQHRR